MLARLKEDTFVGGKRVKRQELPELPKDAVTTVHRVKVSLWGAKPPVWRRLEIPSAMPLNLVHAVLQIAFDWHGYHLHVFETVCGEFGSPSEDYDSAERQDETTATLAQVAGAERAKAVYSYDFGDDWRHDILVEKIIPAEPGMAYPRCTAGRRDAPPERATGQSSRGLDSRLGLTRSLPRHRRPCQGSRPSARTEFLRRRPVPRQGIEPPYVISPIERLLLGHGPVNILGDQFHYHVHHVVPAVAEPGQPLNCLPRLGRVVGQQLVRDHSVQRDVQPRVHRLAAGGNDLFMPLERPCHSGVLCLEQEPALVFVVRIQQLQVEPSIGAMPSGYCPRPPVARNRLVEPVGRLFSLPRGYTSVRPAARRRTPTHLATPPTAGRTPATLWTHRTIIPVSDGCRTADPEPAVT
jgi:hypothetical protein